VFGGPRALCNRSAFGPNMSRRFAAFNDGLSQTIVVAEVRTYQNAWHDCTGVPSANLASPAILPTPAVMLAAVATAPAPCKNASGHTPWSNGNSFYDGLTTALPPNSVARSTCRRSTPT
jgi:hypothetical protein